MMVIRPRNVRTRLTLWYVGILGGVLVFYAAGTSTFLFFNLRHELDRSIIQDLETIEGLFRFDAGGALRFDDAHQDGIDSDHGVERYVEVVSRNGSPLYRNRRLGGNTLGGAPAADEERHDYWHQSMSLPDGTPVRVVSHPHRIADQPTIIRVAHSEQRLGHEFREMLSVLLLGLPIGLAIAGLGGYAMARRALAPLDAMSRRARQITAERLSRRLPVENPEDELGQLALVFNETLARLERSFERLRRFTADASHELRTPLTAIRSVGEVGLQREGDAAYYRDIVGNMLEEVNRLTRLVDSLLTISRADAGDIQLHPTDVRLLGLARESVALLEILAEEKGQRLIVEGDDTIVVRADRLILRQALVNLIDNAVKYSPVSGRIDIRVRSGTRQAIVEVQDSGPGIAPEHRSRIFERFYRVDKARSHQAGGAGLGLALAKWAAEVHGGQIEVESGAGRGSVFRIRLPMN